MRLLLPLAFLLPCLPLSAQEEAPRPARDIVRDFDRVAMPSNSGGSDEESVRRFRQAIEQGCARKAALALELFTAYPEHDDVPRLMDIRWASLNNVKHDYPAVVVETSLLLERDDIAAGLRHAALKARMRAVIHSELSTNRERVEAVRDLLAAHPDDEFAGMGILDVVQGHLADPEVMRPLLELAVELWPDSPYVGRPARPWLKLLDLVGTPLAPRLPEASREAFAAATAARAPFTVVQLWAGRVSPAGGGDLGVLRALRAELGDRVRLVGLVNGDLAELLPAVREAGIDWPQVEARGEKPWVSPLGFGRVPCYFVLDADLAIVGVVGSAKAAALRLRQLAG